MITSQRDLRRAFWQAHPGLSRRRIRDYSGTGLMFPTDTRCAWCDFVDHLRSADQISEALASRVTL